MREIRTHKVNGLNDAINIIVMDEPGVGGANHHYRVEPIAETHPQGAINPVDIRFQNGPIGAVGANGITNESLLAVLIDRLEGFQRGMFVCEANRTALAHLYIALDSLKSRTRERVARGVEGTHEP